MLVINYLKKRFDWIFELLEESFQSNCSVIKLIQKIPKEPLVIENKIDKDIVYSLYFYSIPEPGIYNKSMRFYTFDD